MKFGDALRRRGVAPHIYESREEAEGHLRDLAGRGDGGKHD
jgi:propionate CoA-transferase